MIKSMRLRNFRGFEDIELSDMCPITLISGKNNVGKSAILEAVFLFFDHKAPDSFGKINMIRGIHETTLGIFLWEPVFYQMDLDRKMQITMETDGALATLEYMRDYSFVPAHDTLPKEIMNDMITSAKSTYTLRFQYTKEGYSEEGHFVAGQAGILQNIMTNQQNQIEKMPIAHLVGKGPIFDVSADEFGKIERQQKKQDVINIMQIIDKNIQDIITISANRQSSLYVKTNDSLLPLKLFGDGTNKLLRIISSIMSSPNSIILIDEIEGGFHYSIYQKLWEIVANIAHKYNCQIIATTHSFECINAALDGIKMADRMSDFCYFRINKTNGENRVYRYSHDVLWTAIEGEMEVR